MKAYCRHCGGKREMINPKGEIIKTKKGKERGLFRGKCSVCRTNLVCFANIEDIKKEKIERELESTKQELATLNNHSSLGLQKVYAQPIPSYEEFKPSMLERTPVTLPEFPQAPQIPIGTAERVGEIIPALSVPREGLPKPRDLREWKEDTNDKLKDTKFQVVNKFWIRSIVVFLVLLAILIGIFAYRTYYPNLFLPNQNITITSSPVNVENKYEHNIPVENNINITVNIPSTLNLRIINET